MDPQVERIFGAALEKSVVNEVVPTSSTPEYPSLLPPIESDPKVSEPQNRPMSRLAGRIREQFRINEAHRREHGSDGVSVEMRLHDAMMAQVCKYDERTMLKMDAIGVPRRVYVPLTSTKVRAAKAMLVDLINSAGDPLFAIDPSPDPAIPSEVGEAVAERVKGEIQNIFASLQQSGVQEIPPPIFQKLQELIRQAALGMYDQMKSAEDQYARTRAKRMERKVWDTMVEGGWEKAFAECIDYICTYGTCVMHGPVERNVVVKKCIEQKDKQGKPTGVRKYKCVVKRVPVYEAFNPVDCYPAPDAKDVADGGLCVRVRYTAENLWRYADQRAEKGRTDGIGWNDKAVKRVLDRFPYGGVHLAESQRDSKIRAAEGRGTENLRDCTFEGIMYFAAVRGRDLAELGIIRNRVGEKIRLNDFYNVEAIVIDDEIVYCTIHDDRVGFPLSKGVFYELPGSWWGECVADKLICVQYVMNFAIRSLLQNMGVASGPMYWMNDVQRLIDRSPQGLKPFPHKIWGFQQSQMGASGAPMGVLQVPSNANELLSVFDKMKTQADDDSGIPAYTYGQSSGQGALRTASGLAIFTEAASRGLKMVISTLDRLVIAAVARMTADWLLVYDDDMDIKGDVFVKPVGLMGRIMKAQQDQQRLQVFQLVVGNQFLLQMIGPKGIMELFRPTVRDLNINPDNVIPSAERMEMLETIAGIKQIFEATAAAQGTQENAAPEQNGGGAPGVARAESPAPGTVAERRGVA